MDAALNAIAGQIFDALYELGYRINLARRFVETWRPHHLWCQARAYRSANGVITMSEGSITLAACKCGIARAYDTAGPVRAGDLISSSAFKCP